MLVLLKRKLGLKDIIGLAHCDNSEDLEPGLELELTWLQKP